MKDQPGDTSTVPPSNGQPAMPAQASPPHDLADSASQPVAAPDPAAVAAAVAEAIAAIGNAQDLAELKTVRSAHLGERSALSSANRQIKQLPPAQRPAAGQLLGEAKKQVAQALAQRQAALEVVAAEQVLAQQRVDVTLPTARWPQGARFPLESLMERISDVFVSLGWDIAEGPEVEAEWFNFDALNFGPDHPARQMQDTFYVAPVGSNLVLRTHTSPVQARTLLQRGVPVYIAVPGKTFRTDELDGTHTPVFHQLEGLAVDRGLTMAHLRGTLAHLAEQMFGKGLKTRLRPSFFPFTEPSAEMDLQCFVCRGQGNDPSKTGLSGSQVCRTCGGNGWIEWGGCGMVDPNVLIATGIDPNEYQGFAFGLGIERTAMFRHGIADMHDMVEGDLRFSLHYGTEN